MKWFKHYANDSIQDSKINLLLEKHGCAGYGQYYLLIETLVRSSEEFGVAPQLQLTIRRWSEVLRMKKRNALKFLTYLKDISVINFVQHDNAYLVELCNYKKLLSKDAVSSSRRTISGPPRVEQNKKLIVSSEAIEKDEEERANNPILNAAKKGITK